MNAKEARQKAEIAKNTRVDVELEKVRLAIEKAVANGEFAINVYFTIGNDAAAQLKVEGYTVKTTYDQRDGNFTTISW
jgi:Cu/Ag efflux protein CusF